MEPSTRDPAGASFRVQVKVFPRREILDPEGKAISAALERLGFDGVLDLRAGKSFELELSAVDGASAREEAEEMCRRLLANPIIEDFEVELDEGQDGAPREGGS